MMSEHNLYNFDDRNYMYHEVEGRAGRIMRRLNKPNLIKKFNKDIRSYLKTMNPSHFIYFKASGLKPETLMTAKKMGAKTIGIFPDLDPRVYNQEYLDTLLETDYFFHTKPNLIDYFRKKINVRAKFIYPFFDPSQISAPLPVDESIGVSFVGHWSHGKEKSLINFCLSYTGNVSIFGEGWMNKRFEGVAAKVSVNGPVYGSAIQDIYRRSICVLGLLMEKVSTDGKSDEITSRSVLVPANGGVLLHQKTEAANNLFQDSNQLLFSDIDHAVSLAEKIKRNNELRLELAAKQQSDVLKKATNPSVFLKDLGLL